MPSLLGGNEAIAPNGRQSPKASRPHIIIASTPCDLKQARRGLGRMLSLLRSILTEQTPSLVQLPVLMELRSGEHRLSVATTTAPTQRRTIWFETGVWIADETANNATMNGNQHAYWNF